MTADSFLGRWSRRKADVRAGRKPVDTETPPAPPVGDPPAETSSVATARSPDEPAPAQADEDALSDAELLEKHDLPDPEALTATDDVVAFMRPGVPARLKRMALRRMWRLDPVFANLDGLVDYDQDFTDKATVFPGMATVYRVGRGIVGPPGPAARDDDADRHPGSDGVEASADGTSPTDGPPDAPSDEPPDGPAQTAEADPPDDGTAPQAGPEDIRHEETRPAERPRRRRMVFRAPAGNGEAS